MDRVAIYSAILTLGYTFLSAYYGMFFSIWEREGYSREVAFSLALNMLKSYTFSLIPDI